jgi:hypothetical protein
LPAEFVHNRAVEAIKTSKNLGGRPKGALNKNNQALREMILGALQAQGGQQYLARMAEEQPGPFMSLLGKVLPTTLEGQVSHTINWPVGIPKIES